MMRPKYDEADLALLEAETKQYFDVPANGTLLKLIEEVRIYQDLLAAKEDECRGLECELDHIKQVTGWS